MPQNICFVMGGSGVGKSTFLEHVKYKWLDKIQLIEVGKMLRAKYPPEHFKGQCNPAHTADEAWQMLCEGIVNAERVDGSVAVVDGQPRDIKQANDVLKIWAKNRNDYNVKFIHLYAPVDTRKVRVYNRDRDNLGKLELSLTRVTGDLPSLYNVLSIIQSSGEKVNTFDTSDGCWDIDRFSSVWSAEGFTLDNATKS